MQRIRLVWLLVIALCIPTQAKSGAPGTSSKPIEKNLTFPFPIQWTSNGVDISLIHVAWGPADSPEMLSKGRPKLVQERPVFYPDRPYALALGFQARLSGVIPTISYTTSGLARIRDTDGNVELPMVLTSEGFEPFSGAPGVFDIHFEKNTTSEYWDVFPVAPDQKEFLFRVFAANSEADGQPFSFRVVVRDGAIELVDVSPRAGACLDGPHNFAGVIGASTRVSVHLTRSSASVSGTEQYQRVGKTLWLKGSSDTLGNIVLEERYPEDQVTGIFKGKFSDSCQLMKGYFSKPDGSRLLPFELRQVRGSEP